MIAGGGYGSNTATRLRAGQPDVALLSQRRRRRGRLGRDVALHATGRLDARRRAINSAVRRRPRLRRLWNRRRLHPGIRVRRLKRVLPVRGGAHAVLARRHQRLHRRAGTPRGRGGEPVPERGLRQRASRAHPATKAPATAHGHSSSCTGRTCGCPTARARPATSVSGTLLAAGRPRHPGTRAHRRPTSGARRVQRDRPGRRADACTQARPTAMAGLCVPAGSSGDRPDVRREPAVQAERVGRPCRSTRQARATGSHTLKVTVTDAAENTSVVYDGTISTHNAPQNAAAPTDHRARRGSSRQPRLRTAGRMVGAGRDRSDQLRLPVAALRRRRRPLPDHPRRRRK